jgi:hypothetical protein
MAGTPNLDLLRSEISRMIADGVPAVLVEDVFIGSSAANQRLYERGLTEYAALPKMAREGRAEFRSGAMSPGGRRSVSGFRSFILNGALP